MRGLNLVAIIGNLGNDPEIRYAANGNAIANISLAINESKKDGENWIDHVEWVRAVAFGRTAEVIKDYIHKGDAIHIIGRMQTRSWEKDGVKQYSTEIVINNLIMLGGDSTPGRSREVAPPAPAAPTNHPISEDSLPF